MTATRIAITALCLSLAGFGLAGRVPEAEDSLVGIWSGEVSSGPELRGEMTLERTGSRWTARIGVDETSFSSSGRAVRFAFAGGRGEFRGDLDRQGSVSGFWLQPASAPDEPGIGQGFASPLLLRKAGPGKWRGDVRPLEDRFTLYLRISRDENGRLSAVFRNPERGSRGGASRFQAAREGNSVAFTARPDPARPEIRLEATLVSPQALRITWPEFKRPIELTRRAPEEAPGFFARPPGEPPYEYRRPPETGDGWPSARARDAGMDEAALTRLIRRIASTDPSVPRPALMHSLLVAHRGRLVLEEYFFGFDRSRPHDLRSAGKTFASVLLGAAKMRGARIEPETKVYPLLAGMGPFANPDPRKSGITVAHLLTHTSGLSCDDNDDASPGNEGTIQDDAAHPHWWKATLDLPQVHDPGRRYAYCSMGMNLVGAALTTASRTWLPELFERTVARPLEFGAHYWNLIPDREGYLGGGSYLLPRDLLKVGQAYLDGGVWRGRRIVPASWVAASTSPRVEISEETTGLDAKRFPEFYGRGWDSLAWHLWELRAPDRTYSAYAAVGNGGQLLFVVPDLRLAVVFTAGNYGQGGIWSRFGSEILPREIIPAILP